MGDILIKLEKSINDVKTACESLNKIGALLYHLM